MTLLLRHLDVHELTASAGGDPWQVNKTIQAGSPGEIGQLASAFYEAGVCTKDTRDEFSAAKQRFESAWDRQDGGDHPINDSEEVQRATESLNLNREQMGRTAVDLQNISAALAGLLTFNDVVHGAPAGEEAAQFGGRTLGAIGGGWAAGSAWDTFAGPEGTLIVGFLGAIGGGIGGEKFVDWMTGK